MSSPDTPSSNPYESPPIKSDVSPTLSGGKIISLVLLSLLLIPASAVACFATCLATLEVVGDRPGTSFEATMGTGLFLGLGTGIVTLVVGVLILVRIARSWKRHRNNVG